MSPGREFALPPPAVSLGLTLAIGSLGGLLVDALSLPGGWMIGAIVASFCAGALKAPVTVPGRVRNLAMAFAGMTVGTAVDRELLQSALILPWSALAMFAMLTLLATLTYWLNRRYRGASPATAISCAWPGNVLLAFIGADAMGADMKRVTVVQLVRVLVLMGMLPLVVGGLHGREAEATVPLTLDFALASVIALACAALAMRFKAVGGELILATVVIGLLSAFGVLDFAMPTAALVALQVLVGVYIGVALARCSRQAYLDALMPSLAGAALAAVITLATAFLLSDLLGYPAAALALAFAPGGAEAMILLSAVFDVDPGFVGIHHTLRLLVLSLCFPFILRRFA